MRWPGPGHSAAGETPPEEILTTVPRGSYDFFSLARATGSAAGCDEPPIR